MASDKDSDVSASSNPGALFRKKRIENGWSVSEVAQALCLSVWQLNALENDDYANLPGETYVLGYWRSYAKLLGIPIGEFAVARKKHLGDTLSGLTTEPETWWLWNHVKPSSHLFGFLFALLSVTFLLGIWYWQSLPPDSVLAQGDWQTGEIYEPDEVVSDSPSDFVEPDEWDDEVATQDDAVFSILPESMIALPEPNFSEENDPRPVQSDNREEAALADPDQQPSGVVSSHANPEAAPFHEIAFTVDHESWLEVHDDTGKRLIYRTVAGGRHLTLAGKPPFSVFIGNAAGVTVHYQGAPVAFAAGNVGLFARFTVSAR